MEEESAYLSMLCLAVDSLPFCRIRLCEFTIRSITAYLAKD